MLLCYTAVLVICEDFCQLSRSAIPQLTYPKMQWPDLEGKPVSFGSGSGKTLRTEAAFRVLEGLTDVGGIGSSLHKIAL